MAFGIYVHVPYCLQRCVYCDFATYESSQILSSKEYVSRVKREILSRGPAVRPQPLDTIYFGGGTPSLLEPEELASITAAFQEAGFERSKDAEITIEINPATVDERKLDDLLKFGFNRFSVGAQTFNEASLKLAHRRHSASDTAATLLMLKKADVNFSVDLLFALPGQSLAMLDEDLHTILEFEPCHVSPYCLTVPHSNPLSKNRPREEIQIEMFELIEKRLRRGGLKQYEISNYAKPGFESKHNLLYWNDDEYWGVGLSSHSFLHRFDWGVRFWNSRSIEGYIAEIDRGELWSFNTKDQYERLKLHQALTDFFHTFLRRTEGFRFDFFEKKFSKSIDTVAGPRLERLKDRGLIAQSGDRIALTHQGRLLSNRVFEEMTFLESEISAH